MSDKSPYGRKRVRDRWGNWRFEKVPQKKKGVGNIPSESSGRRRKKSTRDYPTSGGDWRLEAWRKAAEKSPKLRERYERALKEKRKKSVNGVTPRR